MAFSASVFAAAWNKPRPLDMNAHAKMHSWVDLGVVSQILRHDNGNDVRQKAKDVLYVYYGGLLSNRTGTLNQQQLTIIPLR